ncbi:DUF418 domain-containing protein [Winogradskyella poriferorum]|uniref:DUF418 domain-containing protein n=1 Tax=Winogradskyella poriferorum TaxID=307627 RepID=UPI003D650504
MNNQPTTAKQRIELLDIYRGFAIFGIFVVNIVIMHSTYLNQDAFASQWTSVIDQITKRFLQLFFYTKFFPIFSLLFGLGISMQVLKLMDKDQFSISFLIRRLLILFVFGWLHIVLLWSGDVLNIYAILGFFTLIFLKASNKLILICSAILLAFPFYDSILESLFGFLNFKPELVLSNYTGESVNIIITQGNYFQGMKLRLLEYFSNIPILFGFLGPIAFSMFLLGLYLGKNKIYETLETYIMTIKRPIIYLTITTNIYRVLFLFVLTKLDLFKIELYRSLLIKLMMLCDTMMGIFYLWLLGWLWYNKTWQSLLRPLKYVGQMALTNYIMHSVVGLILFTSIGFKLYETLSPFQTFLIAILVFIFQIVISRTWLSYFKFGPLEWLWRCLSYRKFLSIKR